MRYAFRNAGRPDAKYNGDRSTSLRVFGPFRLDAVSQRLWRGDQLVPLTRTEFDLLAYLVQNAGRAFKNRELKEAVWGETVHLEEGAVRRHIFALRHKLGDQKEIIHNRRGIGYSLAAEVKEHSALLSSPPNAQVLVKHLIQYRASIWKEREAGGHAESPASEALRDPDKVWFKQTCTDVNGKRCDEFLTDRVQKGIERGQNQLVLSDFGTGKSYLTLHLFSRQAQRFTASPETERFPIYLPLWRLTSEQRIPDQILSAARDTFGKTGDSVPDRTIFDTMLRDGRFLFLLDGLDEMKLVFYDNPLATIQKFIVPHLKQCQWLISSRTGLFASLLGDQSRTALGDDYFVTRILEWEPSQWDSYVDKAVELGVFTPDPARDGTATQSTLSQSFLDVTNQPLTRQLTTKPLFAWMLVEIWPRLIKTRGDLTMPDLYKEFSDYVIGGRNVGLPRDIRWRRSCLEAMALYLGDTPGPCPSSELVRVAANYMPDAGVSLTREIVATLQTYSLLNCTADGSLSFCHKSFHEYFLALALAGRVLKHGWEGVEYLRNHRLSRDAALFLAFNMGTNERDELSAILRQRSPDRVSLIRRNAVEVACVANISLKGAWLAGLNLSGLNFSGCDLSGANLTGVQAFNASFRNTLLPQSHFTNSTLTNCDFSGSDLSGSYFIDATVTKCDFAYSKLEGIDWKGSDRD